MGNAIRKPLAFLLASFALLNVAWAGNPWASAVGEAYAVQHRAEDIANRIKRTAPQSYLVRHAMAFDHLACSLVERVKCGAPCNQVQALYGQLEGTWSQLRVAIYTDPCLCSDRTLKSLADGMDTRMKNLSRAIQRVVEREFRCAPTISYQVPHDYDHGHSGYGASSFGTPGFSNSSTLQLQFQSINRIPYGVPPNTIHFGVPSYSYRVSPYQSRPYPNPIPYGPGWNQPSWPNHSFGVPGSWRAF